MDFLKPDIFLFFFWFKSIYYFWIHHPLQCIRLVSRSPSFGILRTALEELFALRFSPAGSREVSLVMEGSLIRSAIGDHWDFNKFLAFSWYTCTHDSTFTASKYELIVIRCYGMDKFIISLKKWNSILSFSFH
jgi:hypothetical protein